MAARRVHERALTPLLRALAGVVACAALLLGGGLGTAQAAPADALTNGERATLLAHRLVTRPMQFEAGGTNYIGGVSYLKLRAPAEAVLAVLQSVEDLPKILPRTKSARLIDVVGPVARVEVVQGKGAFEATYTLHMQRDPARNELRFWLDPSRPHDIHDVFGFFRVEPMGEGESLLTVAAALDLGSGLIGLLFEEAARRAVLAAPLNIRDFVERRALGPASSVRRQRGRARLDALA
jgi:Polyketide cyclase / dehydrase and lipid transport